MIWLALIPLIVVHGTRGQEVQVNVRAISSLSWPRGEEHFSPGTKCVIIMNNGKFISTKETCNEVVKLISEARGK